MAKASGPGFNSPTTTEIFSHFTCFSLDKFNKLLLYIGVKMAFIFGIEV